MTCQDPEHPGRALTTHAHAVVLFRTQKVSQHAQHITWLVAEVRVVIECAKNLFIARSLMPLHNELIITIAHHSDCTVPSEYVRELQAWKQSA